MCFLIAYITKSLYICRVIQPSIINFFNLDEMTWTEMKKKAVENGFEFLKHGSRHDIYVNRSNGKIILLERHWSQEVRPGLMNKLKREIGF